MKSGEIVTGERWDAVKMEYGKKDQDTGKGDMRARIMWRCIEREGKNSKNYKRREIECWTDVFWKGKSRAVIAGRHDAGDTEAREIG